MGWRKQNKLMGPGEEKVDRERERERDWEGTKDASKLSKESGAAWGLGYRAVCHKAKYERKETFGTMP